MYMWRAWVIVILLGIFIVRWGFAGVRRVDLYRAVVTRGNYNDMVSYEQADSRFVVWSCITIGYATLALVLTLFPLPF